MEQRNLPSSNGRQAPGVAHGPYAASEARSSRPVRVLLVTEGTYPYQGGGVSSWCDLLIRGMPDARFTVLAVTASPPGPPVFELPEQVDRLITVPLWGIDDPMELDRTLSLRDLVARKRSTTEWRIRRYFLPRLKTLLRRIMNPIDDIGRPLDALMSFHAYFRHYDYDTTMRHPLTWETARVELAAGAASRGLEVPNLQDVTDAAQLLHRLLALSTVDIPPAHVVHGSAAGLSSVICTVAKALYGMPMLLTEHGVYVRERCLTLRKEEEISSFMKTFELGLDMLLAKMSYTCADTVAPVCDFNQRWELRLGADPQKLHTVYNGIIPDGFTPAESEPETPTLVWVGRIDPLKDLITLVQALAEVRASVPDVRLVMYGIIPPGREDYWKEVQDEIKRLGLEDAVDYRGKTSDLAAAYAAGHITLLSSISEAFPYTVIEAMMCAKPVIGTSVGGVAEAIADTGIVVDPRNPQALAAACVELLADHDRRRALGEKARERALRLFSAERFTSQYRELYQSLRSTWYRDDREGASARVPLATRVGADGSGNGRGPSSTNLGAQGGGGGEAETSEASGGVGVRTAPVAVEGQNGTNTNGHRNGTAPDDTNGASPAVNGASHNGHGNGAGHGNGLARSVPLVAKNRASASGQTRVAPPPANPPPADKATPSDSGKGVTGVRDYPGLPPNYLPVLMMLTEEHPTPPADVLELAAALEAKGLGDSAARRQFNSPDIFEVARRLYGFLTRPDSTKPPRPLPARAELKGASLPWADALRLYLQGPVALLPLLLWGSLIVALTRGTAASSHAIFALSAATMLSLLVTSGLIQAGSRKAWSFVSQGEYAAARALFHRCAAVSIAVVLFGAILLPPLVVGFLDLSWISLADTLGFYVALSLLWLVLAALAILDQRQHAVLSMALGAAVGYGGVTLLLLLGVERDHALRAAGVAGFVVGLGAMITVFELRLRERMAASEKNSVPHLPTLSWLSLSLRYYFLYGVLSIALAFSSLLTGWFGGVPADMTRTHAVAGLGMLLGAAIVPYVLVSGIADEALTLYWQSITDFRRKLAVFQEASLGDALTRQLLRHHLRLAVALVVTSVAVYFVLLGLDSLTSGEYLELAESGDHKFILQTGLVGYGLLAVGALNCAFCITISQPGFAARAALVSLLVALTAGSVFSLAVGYQFAVLGLVAGGATLIVASSLAVRVILRRPDYFSYASF